ncbi:MAG: Demethylmenaquinone methyltransferase [Chlamydiia bacterium]|nr:Demethylmenaquinone methyltransferase [Chlamydiia bacterium]MCH9618131.1 Demethylmenaquinone methyltransferase [Chlamydiia bacterium]MCH9624011.1 Demethylmenaquinone methyltransferase [Chlamydiia bacterium]
MLSTMKNSLTKKTFSIAKIFDDIAEKYDQINTILSFGLDKRWRKKMTQFLPLGKELKVLDIACGSCAQIMALAGKRPDYLFTGVDISEKLLQLGRERLAKTSYNIEQIIKASALQLPFDKETFSIITLSFGIRNMEDVDKALSEAARVLKKNGKIFILEFSLPEGKILRKISLFYLRRILPKIGNLISKHSYAYTYLNETIEDFPYGKSFEKLMEKGGFIKTAFYPMTFGMVTLYVGEKADA